MAWTENVHAVLCSCAAQLAPYGLDVGATTKRALNSAATFIADSTTRSEAPLS